MSQDFNIGGTFMDAVINLNPVQSSSYYLNDSSSILRSLNLNQSLNTTYRNNQEQQLQIGGKDGFFSNAITHKDKEGNFNDAQAQDQDEDIKEDTISCRDILNQVNQSQVNLFARHVQDNPQFNQENKNASIHSLSRGKSSSNSVQILQSVLGDSNYDKDIRTGYFKLSSDSTIYDRSQNQIHDYGNRCFVDESVVQDDEEESKSVKSTIIHKVHKQQSEISFSCLNEPSESEIKKKTNSMILNLDQDLSVPQELNLNAQLLVQKANTQKETKENTQARTITPNTDLERDSFISETKTDYQNVYDRLYQNAKQLLFKREFQSKLQEQVLNKIEGKSMFKPKINHNYQSNDRQKQSGIKTYQSYFNDYHDESSQTPLRRDLVRSSSQKGSLSSRSDKLYKDHQFRQQSLEKVKEMIEQQITVQINSKKTNKNSEILASKKIDKDLYNLLTKIVQSQRSISNKFRRIDSSIILKYAPELYSEQAKDLTFVKQNLLDFFKLLGILKFYKNSESNKLNQREKERLLQETNLINSIWSMISLRMDNQIQDPQAAIEFSFAFALFKILFDTYIRVEIQVRMIVNLIRSIKLLIGMSNMTVIDQFQEYSEAETEKKIKLVIMDFKQLYLHYYNTAFLGQLANDINQSEQLKKQKLRKFLKLSDQEQCTFQPKVNNSNSHAHFLTDILQNQKASCRIEDSRCTSEVTDDDEESQTMMQQRKVIQLLDISYTRASASLIKHQQSQQLLPKVDIEDISQKNLLQIYQIKSYQGNQAQSHCRQQYLALGFQTSTVDSQESFQTINHHDQIEQAPSYQDETQSNDQIHLKLRDKKPPKMPFKIDRHQLLYDQGRQLREKKRQRSENVRSQESLVCKDKPDINRNSRIISQRYGNSPSSGAYANVHHRLYSYLDQKMLINYEQAERIKQEQEEQIKEVCTFKPQIKREISYDKRAVSQIQTKGFDKVVKRIKHGRSQREEYQQELENLGVSKHYTGEPTKVIPFTLETEKREQERYQNLKKKPKMIIEIVISTGKSANIQLNEDDDPELLTQNFSKTFNLAEKAKKALFEIIKRHITQLQSTQLLQAENKINTDLLSHIASAKDNIPIIEVREELEVDQSLSK